MDGSEETIVLNENLAASVDGKPCQHQYRAILKRENGDRYKNPLWIVKVQQPINGEWRPCSSWRLSTLLFGFPEALGHKPSDGISIDYGQNWQVDHGMHKALEAAIKYI